MNYIVLDLEWNVPFSLKRTSKNSNTLRGEIIQIGAVKLDDSFEMKDSFKVYVSPKKYTKMQSMVSELTGITDEDLQDGQPFPVAIENFRKWCGKDFCFLIWGHEDSDILRCNIHFHKLDEEWIPDTYNVQAIYDAQIGHENRQCSLTKAMEKIGEPVLQAHDALNDARSTAIICKHLNMKQGLSEYETLEMKLKWNALDGFCSKETYFKKGHALKDSQFHTFDCPLCNSMVKAKGYVQHNGGRYIGRGLCNNGHEFLVKLLFKIEFKNRFRVIRLLYEMDDKNKELYEKRKKESDNAYAAYLKRSGRKKAKRAKESKDVVQI